MSDNEHIIHPPLYMVGQKISCWKCESEMTAMSLLAPNVEGFDGEVCFLTHINKLPKEVYSFIEKRVPSFKMKHSKMAGERYYGNTCPKCGILTGEFFLHSEPGAIFFPMDENDAKSLYLREIPLKKTITVTAAIGTGTGELILNNATKLR